MIWIEVELSFCYAVTLGTSKALTLTAARLEVAVEQSPLWATARNIVVCVRFPVENGLAVEAMSNQFVPPLVDDCHFRIAPVWPLNVILVALPL